MAHSRFKLGTLLLTLAAVSCHGGGSLERSPALPPAPPAAVPRGQAAAAALHVAAAAPTPDPVAQQLPAEEVQNPAAVIAEPPRASDRGVDAVAHAHVPPPAAQPPPARGPYAAHPILAHAGGLFATRTETSVNGGVVAVTVPPGWGAPRVPPVTTNLQRGLGASVDLPTIDPNGRFATTYRPGHGYLDWFDAAVARGDLPAGASDLVGDLGARYAPSLDAPTTGALAWQALPERSALPPEGGHTHLQIALRSTAQMPGERPPLSVHVVLDVSNSMAGDSITNARLAAQNLVTRLDPNDHFSLTTFGGDATVAVPDGLVGPRRNAILQTIASVGLLGGTNIEAGLRYGYEQADHGPQGPEWVRLVLLLSDGRPNVGEPRREALAGMAQQAFQRDVQTSAFGLGQDYDGALMNGIADAGGGGYYYLRDGGAISPALTAELDSRLQPVAQGVEVRVRLRPDIRLSQTYGSRKLSDEESSAVRAQELAVDDHSARRDHIDRNRQNDLEGGMRFFIPGFSHGDRHVILLGIDVPAGVGNRPLATIELRYKDRITHRNVVDEQTVHVRYADSAAASAATENPSVQRVVMGFDAGETLQEASRRIDAGDRAGAGAILAERSALLRAGAERLHETSLAADAARLDRFRNLVGASGDLSQPLVLAMLLNSTGRGMLH